MAIMTDMLGGRVVHRSNSRTRVRLRCLLLVRFFRAESCEKRRSKYGFFDRSDQAHLFQIFTTDKQVAEKAMAELKRGLAFNEVAARYSEGPEKEEGGDLGFISDDVYPEIFGEAFKLKPGKISDIVKSEYGYHIILNGKYKYISKLSSLQLNKFYRQLRQNWLLN